LLKGGFDEAHKGPFLDVLVIDSVQKPPKIEFDNTPSRASFSNDSIA
jgi:hypothetical protein